MCPGSGSWRSGQHRPGTNSEKDGLEEEQRMSPRHVQHRRTASALYCSRKPTDIIGTKRSDWFGTQCKDPAAFRIKQTKNGNLGHIRFKIGLLLSSYARSQPREFFTGCYISLQTPCVHSTPPPPHHPNGIPVQYALIRHTRGSQSRTQVSTDDGKIFSYLLLCDWFP